MSRNIRLGAFIILALVLLFAGVFLIGQNEFLFSRTYRLFANFDNVAGLNDGAAVRVGGVHVGTVDHMEVPDKQGEKVRVAMKLKASTRGVIRKDSKASIMTEGLLGNKYVSISFGTDKASTVQDEDTITGVPPVDLSDLIVKSGEVLEITESTMQNVEQVSSNLKSITGKIDRGKGTIGGLVNDREIYHDMDQTLEAARKGVTSFRDNMEALKGNFFLRGFFKDRGYKDPDEIIAHEISALPKKRPLKRYIFYTKDVFNDPEKAKLENEKILKTAGKFLEENSFQQAVVVGYTGEAGDQEKTLSLTRAQATVIRNYLVTKFKVEDAKLKTKGMGKVDSKDVLADRLEIVIY